MKGALVIILMVVASSSCFGWKMGEVFDGMSTNITAPGSYHDQAAGHYSGGGFSMRTKSTHFQPFAVTPPSLKMGCSGIDMFLGSFSVFKGKELVNMAKNLGSAAASYGFQLALKTFAPQIEQLLSKLRDLAMELNEFSVEECQLAQSLFATALPKDSAMYETVCKDLGRGTGGKDYFSARDNCQDAAEAKKKAKEAEQKDSNKETLILNYNLFMKAAVKAQVPEDMRETMMSMVGTLVLQEGQMAFYEALVKDEDTWNAHVKGGASASLYTCNDDKVECLSITRHTNQTIAYQNSYQAKAAIKLEELRKKMQQNTPFTEEDKGFLSSIGETFPIYDYISFEVVSGEHLIAKSSDLVASYMILQHLTKIIQEVKHAITILGSKQMNDDHIREYLASLESVREMAAHKYQALIYQAHHLEKRARHLEAHQLAKMRG